MASTSAWPVAYTLAEHWQWRPDWSAERACLYWYLAVGNDAARALGPQLLEQVAAVDWLDQVPTPWMHLTLCDVGFTDEIDEHAVPGVIREAERVLEKEAPLRLSLGPVRTMSDALVVEAGPLGRVRSVQHRLREASRATLGLGHERARDAFWPHVTLGYVNRAVDAATVADTVRELFSARATVPVDRVTLAAVTRSNRHYHWVIGSEIGLGGTGGQAPAGR